MKLVANGGTTSEMLVLFWPEQLPADVGQLLASNREELIAWYHSEGKLIWLPCSFDSTYSLAVFVNVDVPENLLPLCHDKGTSPCLTAQGPAYFGGGEYVGKLDEKCFNKRQHLSGPLNIPAGTYTAQIFRTQLPFALRYRWMREHAGTAAFRFSFLQAVIMLLGLIGVIVCLFTFLALSRQTWLYILIPTLISIAVAIGMTRTSWHQRIKNARKIFREKYPDYVVKLTSHEVPS